MAERVAARELDPYSAVAAMIQRAGAGERQRPTFTSAFHDMRAILDHVGIAVKNLDEALAFYRDGLGLHVEVPEEVASQRGGPTSSRQVRPPSSCSSPRTAIP